MSKKQKILSDFFARRPTGSCSEQSKIFTPNDASEIE
jgi:hypothetical protein